jgi:natural product biosynthesis luciferase-like monooxygenase protein
VPGADTPEAFWALLRDGRDAITLPPAGREAGLGEGGYLADVAGFDAACFGISPHEAGLMDPQQRLLCEVAWEALERGGITPSSLAGTRTGVFVGVSTGDYARLAAANGNTADAHGATGNAPSIVANRLSYLLDVRGPSWAVDTACSSSLVAVHQGCDSLRSGASDVALVGGVNVVLTPDLTRAFTRAGMLSPRRRCRTFDAAADGYVRGEGALVLVLKRASDAHRDGDTVWALVRGSAVNQDGRSHGLTAPNGPAQSAVIREAMAQARVTSGDIQLVEAHGTGTALGDPIEVQALRTVFDTDRATPCYLSSTKANIGHLEAAAGIAGLCKVVLAMREGLVPPQVHFVSLNPRIALGEALAIATVAQPWPEAPRRLAGVSAFGFGGTNAHVIVEGVPRAPRPAARADAGVLPLSARTPAALRVLLTRVMTWLDEQPEAALAPLSRAWSTTRDPWPHRLVVVANTTTDAVTVLRRTLAATVGEAAPAALLGDVLMLTPAEQLATEQFLGGATVDWAALYPDAGRIPDAPTYPFEPVPHWLPASAPVALPVTATTAVTSAPPSTPAGAIRFGVMFFAANADAVAGNGYRLLLDVARYVDTHGFSSIWLPERHFTALGGAYPSPAVLHAALAMCTQHVRLQAGSVVAPLHHPVRLVEDWSIVDTLSNGRAGISLAAGWHPDDFALAPTHYVDRQAHLYRTLDTVRALWRGEPFIGPNGLGQQVTVRPLPRPVQPECPVWITAAANPDSFERAGTAGANLLTHLLDQDVDALAAKIVRYRAARAAAGFDPAAGQVSVMIHTFVGDDEPAIREEARAPFCSYINDNIGLLKGLAQSRGQQVDLAALAPDDRAEFVDFLYERFASSRGLIGTPDSCLPLVQRLEAIGVNEIAALLDFGPPAARVLESLHHLERLRQLAADRSPSALCYTRVWEAAASHRAALGARFRLLSHGSDEALTTAVRAAFTARGFSCTDGTGPADAITIDLRAVGGSVGENVPGMAHRRIVDAIATARDAVTPVVFVTQGAFAIRALDVVSPSGTAIWGVGRSLQVERPGRLGLLIDLDPAMSAAAQAESLVSAVVAPPDEDMVAIRDHERLVPRLVRTDAPTGRAVDVIASGCSLITGGTGGLGLALAHRLLDDGVRDLALVGRRPMAEADFAPLAARAQSLNALVTVHAADVADGPAMHALFASLAASSRVIRAVYHAAGVLDDAMLPAQDPARIARVLAPKVDGAWHLRQLAERHGVALLVFFSSVSSVLPAPGQASYAAANAFLDGLAMEARAAGLNAHSINWGPWAGTGHAATAYGRAAHARLSALGIRALTVEHGLEMLLRVAAAGVVPLVVADVDWGQLAASDPLAARLALLRPLITPATARAVSPAVGVVPMPPVTAPASPVPTGAASTGAASTGAASTGAASTGRPTIAAPTLTALTQTLIALDDGARRARLFTHLVGAIQATLKRPADDAIPLRQPLFDFGLDSILALELKEQLERDFGITLKATVLFTHPTLEALVDHLLAGLPAAPAEAAPAEAAPAEAAPAASGGEDIAALLRLALQSRSTST